MGELKVGRQFINKWVYIIMGHKYTRQKWQTWWVRNFSEIKLKLSSKCKIVITAIRLRIYLNNFYKIFCYGMRKLDPKLSCSQKQEWLVLWARNFLAKSGKIVKMIIFRQNWWELSL